MTFPINSGLSINPRNYIPLNGAIIHDAGLQSPVTAGHVFCTITPPGGRYQIDIHRIAYGNGTPSVANNSHLSIGANDYTLSTGAVLGVEYWWQFYVELNGSTPLSVVANGNGSPNIGVSVGITAVQIP